MTGWWNGELEQVNTDIVAETHFLFHWNSEALRLDICIGLLLLFCRETQFRSTRVLLRCYHIGLPQKSLGK